MQILSRQNIFKVQKSPSLNRENKFFQSTTASRQCQIKKGIRTVRNYSIDFDQLYNPYRMQELGSFEERFATAYKSLETKEFPVCCTMKCIRLGQKLQNSEIESAVNSQSIVSENWKAKKITGTYFERFEHNQPRFQTNKSSLLYEQIQEDMFGNVGKISQIDQSFISFPSKSNPTTVFFSIVSKVSN